MHGSFLRKFLWSTRGVLTGARAAKKFRCLLSSPTCLHPLKAFRLNNKHPLVHVGGHESLAHSPPRHCNKGVTYIKNKHRSFFRCVRYVRNFYSSNETKISWGKLFSSSSSTKFPQKMYSTVPNAGDCLPKKRNGDNTASGDALHKDVSPVILFIVVDFLQRAFFQGM